MAGEGSAHLRPDIDPVLAVEGLVVEYPLRRGLVVHAVSGVSLDVARGETIGVVGESGCGKTTLGRAIMQLEAITSGTVRLGGRRLDDTDAESLRWARRSMQMIFQDPVSSLNPRRRVRELVREGLEIWGAPEGPFTDDRVDEVMRSVGLEPSVVGERRPHEFSGGQCQRICIARALVMDPEVLILDEPVSALDVSVQAQILNLLRRLRRELDLAMIFISHDLAVVKNVSDRILVMYLGKVCEVAPADDIFVAPAHPYTRALLAAIPGNELGLSPARELIAGDLPVPTSPPSGCRFRTRCPRASRDCATDEPEIREIAPGHHVACHHADEAGSEAPSDATRA